MRVFVTGGFGFIGVHLRRYLAQRGLEVLLLEGRGSRTAPLASNETVVPRHFDSLLPTTSSEDLGADVVFHLAWDRPNLYQSAHHLESEVERQNEFVDWVGQSRMPRCVFLGSCFEFGLVEGPMSEKSPLAPSTLYGLAKTRVLEHVQSKKAGLQETSLWVRLFYPFGEGQANGSLWSAVHDAANKGTPLELSAPSKCRDFIPVGEVAHVLAMLGLLSSESGVVNFGSGRPRSVRSQAIHIAHSCQLVVELSDNEENLAPRNYEGESFWSDNTRLYSILERARDGSRRRS